MLASIFAKPTERIITAQKQKGGWRSMKINKYCAIFLVFVCGLLFLGCSKSMDQWKKTQELIASRNDVKRIISFMEVDGNYSPGNHAIISFIIQTNSPKNVQELVKIDVDYICIYENTDNRIAIDFLKIEKDKAVIKQTLFIK
jgi:hypothetical protein